MFSPIINAALDNDIKQKLLEFALKNQKDRTLFISNGVGRQYCNIKLHQPLFNFDIKQLMVDVFASIELYNITEEPMFGIFLGVNNKGGSVHQHTDPAPKGKIHTRINFLLLKPDHGGMPIINNVVYNINEGQSWINLASLWQHSSTTVDGNKDRVVLSVGALVDEQELKQKFQNLEIE